ncbi:MAG: biosynthetic peptidoglycan transglycosylase [bacterium]|nr:biosynthetic peptidoglycan transglycosylase [bacterium]
MKTSISRKFLTSLLVAGALGALAAAGWLFLAASDLPDIRFLAGADAVVNLTVRDWNGEGRPFALGPGNPSWTPLEKIPPHLRDAVLAGEDFSFYSHGGVDWFEVRQSIMEDLRERRFARGASTITQQLAKNLFLSSDKTIRRKVRELLLARRLEAALTKDRILELYLNVVELGNGVYGVGAGARHHFGKEPGALSLRESAFLAAMLPGPRVFDPDRNMDRVLARSDHILGVMLKGRMITDGQYQAAQVQVPAAEPSFPYAEPLTFTGTDESNSVEDPGSDARGAVSDEGRQEAAAPEDESPYLEEGISQIPIGTQGKDPGM